MFGRSSLRVWLLAVSVLFAMAVVGGIAITTYVIVSDGMSGVAYDASQRIAASASTLLRDASNDALLNAAVASSTAQPRQELATATFRGQLPSLLTRPGIGDADYALYDASGRDVWSSDPKAVWPSLAGDRHVAVEQNRTLVSEARRGSMLSGLFSKASLSINVAHVPIRLPDATLGVLDVTYMPTNEERVIDAVRAPMAALAISAMLIMVVLMQTSMAWVLTLVGNLRKAADSIEAGQLDARLPERAWGAEDPKVRDEAVDAIDRESRRMARLTGDLLNLLHADQGLVLKTDKFDVNVLVRDRLAATASRWIEKEMDFVGPEDEEPLVVCGDPDRFEDVVSILLDNAAKYTPEHGRVVASTRKRRDIVELEITDTGQGIPPADLPRIFDRFFRSEASRAAGEGGFGLGLAICKSIVDSMGGTIDVQSEVGRGTTFYVRIPRGRM